ncbi:MAG: hypothetical protein A2675_00035 [Candidatus Yonathbacteria bacterium RIFCSPHIGHO2_01_FULL_51_10]|uniref:Uncharacterized protein n=1 Tax=Candidatus Yonathbacteria bacterium RIFCSPHIGHO2_01_FULL_51_10 TaxID=1802723 RepID=A0A1G2S3Z9_9BACT|nr:MAG: hypothetical protein A2675_00035 [Candidatus Yonathbacteria bacterium RIFCSPHIGHO2_01_FULL_51_10]
MSIDTVIEGALNAVRENTLGYTPDKAMQEEHVRQARNGGIASLALWLIPGSQFPINVIVYGYTALKVYQAYKDSSADV